VWLDDAPEGDGIHWPTKPMTKPTTKPESARESRAETAHSNHS
jgi:hypothetical protein